MSPEALYDGDRGSNRFVHSSGRLGANFFVQIAVGVRPIINLKADSLKSGDGSALNPYTVESVWFKL